MTAQKRERLISIYKVYNIVDWIIALAIIGTPLLFMVFQNLPEIMAGYGFSEAVAVESLETFMYAVAGLPAVALVPIFLVYSAYPVFCFVLYVKVWTIKEIRDTFTYWFDWVLTIFLTAYELFIFYLILFG